MADPTDFASNWDDDERERLRMSLSATPAQRLAWLEEAMRIAARHARVTPDEIVHRRESQT